MEKIQVNHFEKPSKQQPKNRAWIFIAIGALAFLGLDFLPWAVSMLWALGFMGAGAYFAWKDA
ncbi:hypothetical protein LJC61_03050 [Ruminococcaceae bacterium OttesenSCG-928-A16]|nr:hypothetical protein [Ruminococcaceae bacterium OttesenSCG-928-A16]